MANRCRDRFMGAGTAVFMLFIVRILLGWSGWMTRTVLGARTHFVKSSPLSRMKKSSSQSEYPPASLLTGLMPPSLGIFVIDSVTLS